MKTMPRNPALAALLLAIPLALPASLLAQTAPPRTPPAKTPAAAPAPPQDPLAPLLAQTQAALDRNDFTGAVPLIQQILAARPADALAHFELGYAYSELKRNEEAAAEYRRAIELDPKLAAAHINLGLVLRDSDPLAAADAFRAAAALTPDQGRPHYLAGTALERAAKNTDALAEYTTAVSLAPTDQQMHLALARALLVAGRAADAETAFREAATLAGDPVPAKLGLAETLLHEDKNAEAVAALADYLFSVPGDRHARFERAVALQNLDRYDEALAELDRVEQDAAPAPENEKLRASIYLQQSKWPEAIAILNKAVAAWPADPEFHAWLGRAQMKVRDYPAAESELRRSLALDSQIAPLGDLAMTLYESGQYPSAISTLDLLDARRAPLAIDWFVRAICYDKLRQPAPAANAYQKFLDLDQGHNADQDWQAQQRIIVLDRELHNKR